MCVCYAETGKIVIQNTNGISS